jgi:AAA15 family ATPase/GTPase
MAMRQSGKSNIIEAIATVMDELTSRIEKLIEKKNSLQEQNSLLIEWSSNGKTAAKLYLLKQYLI